MSDKDRVNKDLANSFSVPTVIGNRFVLSVGPGGLRIAFGEAGVAGQDTQWRHAVHMTREEAADLNKVLSDLLKQVAN